MDFDTQVVQLSQCFYSAYPSASFPEILEKGNRPYNCLLVDTHYDFYICIPFRTHIRHKYSYRFRNSIRSRLNNSGIDYTKMVLIQDPSYISDIPITVDQDEYHETMQNIRTIIKDALAYIDDYIAYIHDNTTMSPQAFSRKYGCSSLRYFDNLLGIHEQSYVS